MWGAAARVQRVVLSLTAPSSPAERPVRAQSAIFNLPGLLTILLLFICTCAYLRPKLSWINNHRRGLLGTFFMAGRVGERASFVIAPACIVMAVYVLFIQ